MKEKKQDEASLVEYALLVALIAVVCIAAIRFVGLRTSARYSETAYQILHAG